MNAWTALFLALFGATPFHIDSAQQVLTIESDAMQGATAVDVLRDELGNLTGLSSHSSEGNAVSYTIEQLRQGPQLFKQVDGHNVVFFSIEKDFEASTGGHANLRFLQSGISDTYKNFRMKVVANGADIQLVSEPNLRDPESDKNRYRDAFNYLYMNKNTFWGKVIGIESVTPQLR